MMVNNNNSKRVVVNDRPPMIPQKINRHQITNVVDRNENIRQVEKVTGTRIV